MATEAHLEVLNDAYLRMLLAGDFETTSDPRGHIKLSQRLLDAAIACGMDRDEADLRGWVASTLFDWLASPIEEAA